MEKKSSADSQSVEASENIQEDESESFIIALNRMEPGIGNICRVSMSLPDQPFSKRFMENMTIYCMLSK